MQDYNDRLKNLARGYKMEDIKLFKELFIDKEDISTIGERDFSEFIKRVNRHLTSEDRYKILEFIIGDNNNE